MTFNGGFLKFSLVAKIFTGIIINIYFVDASQA